MTIHPRPDQEQMIEDALRAGLIRDPEDVLEIGLGRLRQRLAGSDVVVGERLDLVKTNLVDVFDPVRGLADDLRFERNPSTGRPVDL